MSKPTIAIIGTGGTISSVVEDTLDVLNYPDVSRKMDPSEAIARIPEAARFAQYETLPFRAVGSTAIGPTDWIELAQLISRTSSERPDIRGFVILHGTATIEETGYFLNLVLKTNKPVVLVGAQRPASAISTDVNMNVISAVRTALCDEAIDQGVMIVLNDEIHTARDATKTSTYRLQTFQSRDFGLLGHVDGDRVSFYRKPMRKHTLDTPFDIADITALPRVDIAYSYGGADGCAVDAFVSAGAQGIISAGLAPGIPAPLERLALERAAASGIVVVQSSRAGSGRVARRKYLQDQGIVGADNLNPQKARVLLLLALTKTRNPDQIQELFNTL